MEREQMIGKQSILFHNAVHSFKWSLYGWKKKREMGRLENILTK